MNRRDFLTLPAALAVVGLTPTQAAVREPEHPSRPAMHNPQQLKDYDIATMEMLVDVEADTFTMYVTYNNGERCEFSRLLHSSGNYARDCYDGYCECLQRTQEQRIERRVPEYQVRLRPFRGQVEFAPKQYGTLSGC